MKFFYFFLLVITCWLSYSYGSYRTLNMCDYYKNRLVEGHTKFLNSIKKDLEDDQELVIKRIEDVIESNRIYQLQADRLSFDRVLLSPTELIFIQNYQE